MTDSYGPFEGVGWGEAEWMDFAYTWAPSRVLGSPTAAATSGELAFSSSGLTVSAGPGKAWVAGAGFKRTGTPPTHAVTANAHATFSRRDRLVLRRDLANNQIVTAVVQGTPQASPTAPALTQNLAGVWELPLFSFLVPPANGTSITGVVDERTWLTDQGIFGKLWRTNGFSTPLADGVFTRVGFDGSRLLGGVAFDDAADKLTLPAPGFYELKARGHASAGSGYAASYFVQRQRTGVAALDVLVSLGNSKATTQDINPYFADRLPFLAGDGLVMNVRHDGSSAGTYWGNSEAVGVMLSARWVAPLDGATAI